MKLEKYTHFLFIALLICSIDQITKMMAVHYLTTHHEIEVNSWFNFLLIYNKSTIFVNYQIHDWPIAISLKQFKLFYAGLMIFILTTILWFNSSSFMKHVAYAASTVRIGLVFLFAGASGNLMDHIFRAKGVVDFIKLYPNDEVSPVMNLADVMIGIGQVFLFASTLLIIQLVVKKHRILKQIKNNV